jgi:predicted amidohydrolase
MKETFKLALAQISCERGDKARNLKKIEETVIAARRQGAELVIFPELSVTGYTVRDQLYELAETIPGHQPPQWQR